MIGRPVQVEDRCRFTKRKVLRDAGAKVSFRSTPGAIDCITYFLRKNFKLGGFHPIVACLCTADGKQTCLIYLTILPFALYRRRPLWSVSVGERPAAGFVRGSRASGKQLEGSARRTRR